MCGFGIGTIFEVAIFIIVVLAIIALIQVVMPGLFAGFGGAPYGSIIRIVIGAVVAILILLFLWKLAECAGLIGGGRMGLSDVHLGLLRLLG